MRLRSSLAFLTPALLTALVACAPASPDVAKQDMLRDARVGCDKGSGPACYHAGVLYGETGKRDRAAAAHLKGCTLREVASCDALAGLEGADRAQVLAEACTGGDLLSCSRLADTYPKDPAGVAKTKALLEDVCRASSAMTSATPSRDLEGAAGGCARLAALHARGDVGRVDPLTASRLDTLATLLFTESLFRREKQEDAAVDRAILTRPVTATDKDRFDREEEADHLSYEHLLQALDVKTKEAAAEGATRAGTPLTVLEEIFGLTVMPGRAEGAGGAAGSDDAACRDTGDPIACTVAAVQADKTDPAAALTLVTAGCTKKPDQCWGLIGYAETSLRKRDGVRATQILEKGCEAKSAAACFRLALENEQGERGIAQDLARAAKFFQKACDFGSARGCLTLGTLVEDGRGVGKDAGRVKALHTKADTVDTARRPGSPPAQLAADEQACRQNHLVDKCTSAATAYQDTDAVKAEELHRTGCTANKNGCGLWSFAVDRLRRDDSTRGMRLLESGCEEGSAVACATLAEILHIGYRTTPRAEARAAEVYQKACDLGDAYSCRVTASRFRAVKNTARADELRDLGVKAEEADRTHADGEHWAKDAAEVRQRGPQAHELARALGDWKALVERSKARSEARTKKLESAFAGRRPPTVPPFAKEELDASATRETTIKKNVASIFQRTK